MCHAPLNCAVRYCIVDQAVLGVRILTELIWILSSSCLNAELGLPAVETRGALDQLEHKIRFSSEALARDILTKFGPENGRTEARQTKTRRTASRRTETIRTETKAEPTRLEARQDKARLGRAEYASAHHPETAMTREPRSEVSGPLANNQGRDSA